MWKRVTALVMAAAALACGGGGGGSTGPYGGNNTGGNNNTGGSTSANITVSNNKFTPSATTVPKGTTVTWTWDSCSTDPYGGGTTCTRHNVTFDDGQASATQSDGSYSRTFDAAGTYNYHCTIHGTAMSGSVKVQ
jgi:plastocyanin